MVVSENKLQVKVRSSRLLELGLYSSLLSALTVLAWWFWVRQTVEVGGLGGMMPEESLSEVAASMPILTRLLLQKSIIFTFALAQSILGLALLLALVPGRWWLGIGLAEHSEDPFADCPDEMLDDTSVQLGDDPANPAGVDPAAAQGNGQPGTAQPGATSPTSEQSQSSQQPGTPAAPGQASSLEISEIPEEEELLESLSDVSDILASFVDDEPTDPLLAKLSASLEDIEITALADASRRMAHQFHHSQLRRSAADHPNKPVGQRQLV